MVGHNKLMKTSAIIYIYLVYRQTGLFCFTELWLSEDNDVHIDGFNMIQLEIDMMKIRKAIGGGDSETEYEMQRLWAPKGFIQTTLSALGVHSDRGDTWICSWTWLQDQIAQKSEIFYRSNQSRSKDLPFIKLCCLQLWNISHCMAVVSVWGCVSEVRQWKPFV